MTEYSDCVECGRAISSQRQIAIRGVQTCEYCAETELLYGVLKEALSRAEKDFIARQFVLLSE